MILSCRPILAQRGPARNKKKKALYKNCKNCGSANLLESGPDQICCDCDWHTCFEYVDRGYMNNLQYAYCEHFPKQRSVKSKDIQVSEYNYLGDSKVV
ncbi:MAG: hypothetical protein B7Y39_18990 [Bdellovibrio sp. 28-41-41]|nr:MAG: hypothetical protein B7Y39_18990 [Bdellovibrio sp. 28-41-41]